MLVSDGTVLDSGSYSKTIIASCSGFCYIVDGMFASGLETKLVTFVLAILLVVTFFLCCGC